MKDQTHLRPLSFQKLYSYYLLNSVPGACMKRYHIQCSTSSEDVGVLIPLKKTSILGVFIPPEENSKGMDLKLESNLMIKVIE